MTSIQTEGVFHSIRLPFCFGKLGRPARAGAGTKSGWRAGRVDAAAHS